MYFRGALLLSGNVIKLNQISTPTEIRMVKIANILTLIICLMSSDQTNAQTALINPALLKGSWSATWIKHPESQGREYGIYHFRKTLTLIEKPNTYIINVTADNRYRLFVNGHPVCSGPARGDLYNWYFETVDIALYLHAGTNIIAAQVWNMGELAAVAQISNQTGFLIQGNTDFEKHVNTGPSWKVLKNEAYTPCSTDNGERLHAYMVVGPGDRVQGTLFPWGWESTEFNDGNWKNAVSIAQADPVGYGTDNRWTLSPRTIPVFKETMQRFKAIRRSSGISTSIKVLTGKKGLTIPSNQTVRILLDQSVNTVAYPELIVSGGNGATVKLTYGEALFDQNNSKGDRNQIEGKDIRGNYDIFLPDGGLKRKFRPLWFKGFRYIQLDITTKTEPLTLDDIYNMKTGYPLVMHASFTANDKSLGAIWSTGWRTAELCAGELYYDTPYYEQLQYTGDSRIQALISLYNSGDDRLMRKAITDFYHSRTPEGLTQGRYPSNRLQIIPPFSLFWVSMIHDYWMHRKDNGFIHKFLPAIAEIMQWYSDRIDQKQKMLGPLTWWNFIDWDNFDGWGAAPGTKGGNSSIVTLQYAYTLHQAADLFKSFGQNAAATLYTVTAEELAKGTYLNCYVKERGLIADTPEKLSFSQHAGIWAILSGAVPDVDVPTMMKTVLEDKSIGQVTFFYRFYLTQALKKANMADLYYSQLTPWRDMLKLGLTTFAEKPEPTRSDCHAWSASPNYDFLATICGIMPDAPGFDKVVIKPALGDLTSVEASMPHPAGKIAVKFKREGKDGIAAKITLPEGLSGTFIWKNKPRKLTGGFQSIHIL
jgi:alpha-L-rhamnosidase